jgi:type IV pilus assembly protein PilB
MAMAPRIRDLTLDRASAAEVKKAAIAEGMLTLRRDGLEKLKRGLTSAQEILKESAADEL